MLLATWLTDMALFAAQAADEVADKGDGGGGLAGWQSMLMLWVPIGLLFYLLLIRPQQRQQAQRRAMLAQVKKNDRVIAAGGIYGVVTNVRLEADEVTVRVDETTNTKIRVTLSSIVSVVGDDPSVDKAPPK